MDEETLRSQQISKEMKKDFKEKSKVVKLLLLGTGAVKGYFLLHLHLNDWNYYEVSGYRISFE